MILVSARHESAEEHVELFARVAIHGASDTPHEGEEEQALQPEGDSQLRHLGPAFSAGFLDLVNETGVESHQGSGEVNSRGHHEEVALVTDEVCKKTKHTQDASRVTGYFHRRQFA